MESFQSIDRLNLFRAILLPTLGSLTLALQPLASKAQEIPVPGSPTQVRPVAPTDPENTRPLISDSILSLEGGQRLMAEAEEAIAAENYELASQKLQEARQVFNQLSNFYSQLAASFSGIDNRLADTQRTKALDTAQMRDSATYQLALVHRAQNQPELAVPLLVQIISSQQPTRELGQKAYQQLLELGFVDLPYPRSGDSTSSSSSN